MKKFNENLYLTFMYKDEYYPKFLVDKIKDILKEVVLFLENNPNIENNDIQEKLDIATDNINDLCDEFYANDSDIETMARESIAETVEEILKHFNVDIDIETAIRNRDW